MQNKQLFNSFTLTNEQNEEYLLKYFLLHKPSSQIHGETVYGVSIEQESSDSTCLEYEEIHGISYIRNEALHLLQFLSNGKVTPVSLNYIVDDYFDN